MSEKDIEKMIVEEKREYYRKWRAENKDKIKENNRKYWLKKAMQKADKK